jgi:hypothetical protein
MSYIINGTEVKVGQIWITGNGQEVVIDSFEEGAVQPIWGIRTNEEDCEVDSSYHANGVYFLGGTNVSVYDLIRCISEPETVINVPKEQSVQETATVITDLRNEEPSQDTEYRIWGDLPDGTAVLDADGELFIVNNSNQVAAFSANGNYLMRRDELFTGCTIVQIEIQIKKTIRKF